MTFEEAETTLANVKYRNCGIMLGRSGETMWFQFTYPVVEKGVSRTAYARRWIIEPNWSAWQLVATAFKAALTVEEHEAREAFLYKGAAVFYPHNDLEEMVSIRKHHAAAAGTSEAEDAS